VEVGLLHAAIFERDFGFQRGGQSEDDAAGVGIHNAAAIDGADHAMHADVAVFFHRSFDHLRDVARRR
jgi:hypothetical protein